MRVPRESRDPMASSVAGAPSELLVRAQLALKKTQSSLGAMLGLSRRTIVRWTSAGWFTLTPAGLETLVAALHPVDPELAQQLAASHGATLEGLGVKKDPAPRRRLVEIVVCAAAEALDVSPRAVRPALLAAARCAREVGVSFEEVEEALEARLTAKPAADPVASRRRVTRRSTSATGSKRPSRDESAAASARARLR